MEWNAKTIGAQAVSMCASQLTTTVATTSVAHIGTTTIIWSWPISENTPEWNEWLVCVLHSYESSVTCSYFQLRSPVRTESWATYLSRRKREWALEEEEKAEKGKASRIERGGNYSGPKYCCVGKGSVVAPSFSYLRVAKMTPGAG